MAESGAEVAIGIVLLVLAAAAAILWNAGVLSTVFASGLASDPAMQIFLLVVFAIVLAEFYIVNIDKVRARLDRIFRGNKYGDFYEKARAQRSEAS